MGTTPPPPSSSDVNAVFNKFADVFVERVQKDEAYINACKNSDEQNARTECDEAVKRVMDSFGFSDIDLYKAYFDNATFQSRLKDHVFGMTYGPLSHPADQPPRGNTLQHRNFRALAALAPEIVSGESSYIRFTAGASFMPLTVERLRGNRVSVAHNYEQNGDLMADPDMEFVMDTATGTLSARTYQQDGLALYQTAEGGDGEIVNTRLARRLDSFARQWFSNIRSQQYQREKMTVVSRGEEIEVVYGADGQVSAINGETDAIDAYARKIGIEPPPYDEEEPEPATEAPPIITDTDDTPHGSTIEPGGVFSFRGEEQNTTDLYIRDALLSLGYTAERRQIYEYFIAGDQTGSAYASFLRRVLDTGLHTFNASDGAKCMASWDENGIIITPFIDTPDNEGPISLSWPAAAGRIYRLVQSGEYYTPEPSETKPAAPDTQDRTRDGEMLLPEPMITTRLSEMGQTPAPRAPREPKPRSHPSMYGQISLVDVPAVGPDQPVVPGTAKPAADLDVIIDDDLFEDDDGTEAPAPEMEIPPAPASASLPKPLNFRITPDTDIGGGGAKTKCRRNIEAVRLLKTIEAEGRYATPEEQRTLALYAGWGGISQVFMEGHPAWQREHAELKELLTDKEYRAAEGSTLNAHYTTPEIIEGIYTGLDRLGFNGGNVLEPAMGVGNFYGCMPEELASASRLYGVELDSITGRIARQLYPNANIQVQGFETADLPDSFFDAVIGNVPFGQYKVSDPRLDRYGFLIHDYFIAKSLDKLRPGGVFAVITSKGTMDKANTSIRRYLAERAELLGAIRLPNTAFKSSAGTEVTSDILFLKKRDRMVDASEEPWIHTGKTDDGVPLNEYYLDNPHMMLGTMAFDSSMYGNDTETTLNPDGRDLHEALLDAVALLPEGAFTAETVNLDDLDDADVSTIPADPRVKNFCYAIMDDGLNLEGSPESYSIYQRVNAHMEKKEFGRAAAERVTAMIGLRAATRYLLDVQLQGVSDGDLSRLQGELNRDYDWFFKKFGPINARYNVSLFGDDADFPLLSAIEELDQDGAARKAAIFTKRTIAPVKRIERVDTALEALPVCLNALGRVDVGYMAQLCDRHVFDVIDDLRGVIFKNPAYDDPDDENNLLVGWETADEYLSGRVKDKLAAAEMAADDNPLYTINVEALRAVQPKPLEAHEISARIGAHWIGTEYYRQFLIEKLNVQSYELNDVQVHYTPQTGSWTVGKPHSRHSSVEAQQTFGTPRMDAYTLFESTLNQRNARIYDLILVDGKEKRVLNHKATVAIRDRQTKLKEEFRRWIFDDPERREKLCAIYNDLFNAERSRKYDGAHLTFPGMSPEVTLNPHQSDGVARILYGGNSLLAHVVGAGKTYTMAAAAMEMKRIGLARKPCFVVPNHLVGQWANEFQRLYPTANILAATRRDFEKQNRRRFCARIATGEWDAVIIGHSSLEKVPMSRERQEDRLQRDIDDLSDAIIEAKAEDSRSLTVKELQRALKNLEYELKRLQSSPKDGLVTFEELGVDALFVDESHFYKNKFIFSKMSNVAGLSKARAKKSTDMDMKCEYINEQNGGPRGVIHSTGTPLSNSMVEMYTVQTYLQREELRRLGLHHFDNWASNFGEVVSALELAPSGQGYRVKERFAKFVNLPELMALFHKVADIQTADMLDLPVPKIMGGKPVTVSVDPSPELRAYTEQLVKRSERIYKREVLPEEDNMLCVTNDGRNAALDLRCIDPAAPDYPDSKVNICVQKVFEIFKETETDRLTQMIFCDLSTPKGGRAFSVYDDIRTKLIALGINPSEITFIHEANTDEQKEKMFAAVRRGEIRVILGSTMKMGAGTNAQTRLVALHHLDCPYRPSDLEQREGRIVRQGNMNPEVRIFQYVTRQSFDSYLWQIVEAKQRFISQVMTGRNPSREMEDIDETVLNYAEVKAIATGNPLIRRKHELDMEVQRLRILEAQYRADRYSLEDSMLKRWPAKLADVEAEIKGLEADIERRDAHSADFHMRLGKHEFSERKDAGDMLLKAVHSGQYVGKVIGYYRGFEIIPLEKALLTDTVSIALKGIRSHTVDLSDSGLGSIARIENTLNRLDEILADDRREDGDIQRRIEATRIQLNRPFDQQEALHNALSELETVNAELDVDKGGDAGAVIDENAAGTGDVLEIDGDAEDEDEDELEI